MKPKRLLLLLALMASTSLFAQTSGTCGPNLSWVYTNGVLIISGTGDMTNFSSTTSMPWAGSLKNSITMVVINNGTTSIGNYAFSGCKGLTSVVIPNSVTSIGEYAFMVCSGLTSVAIPDSVTSIGDHAFADCSGLTSVAIGNSVSSIGLCAFRNCSSLTSVIIPDSVTSVGNYAFEGCSGLTTPVYNSRIFAYMPTSYSGAYGIPDGIECIAGTAFYGCSGLTSVTIPNSVISVGNNVFGNCSGLTTPVYNSHVFVYMPTSYSGTYDIPDGIECVAGYAFFGCRGLVSISIPNSVTSIESSAFRNCSNMTSVMIPDSVTSIGGHAFAGCSGLTSVAIGNSVTIVGDHAFNGCGGLTSIVIPNSVTSIEGHAFFKCSNLDLICCKNSIPPQLGEMAFDNTSSSLKIIVPCGTLGAYQNGWSAYASKIQITPSATIQTAPLVEGTGQVNVPQFICDTILEAIPTYGYHFVQWNDSSTTNPRVIDSEVEATYIAEFALDKSGRCGDDFLLQWAYDSDNHTLTISGNGTFNSNLYYGIEAPSEMTSLVIEDSVQSVGASAFAGISTLTSVALGQDVSRIRENAFFNCENLSVIRNYRSTPATIYSTTFDGVDKFACTLYVPEGSVAMYSVATGWRDFFNIVGFNPTGYENLSEDVSSVRKVCIDGQLYILLPDGTKYSATGKKVE